MQSFEETARKNFKEAYKASGLSDEWRITMYFYAALHAINHRLVQHGHNVDTYDHQQRRQALVKSGLFTRELAKAYARLTELSHNARYKPQVHPMSWDKVEEARDAAREILDHSGIQDLPHLIGCVESLTLDEGNFPSYRGEDFSSRTSTTCW
jgi:hypothetical protein